MSLVVRRVLRLTTHITVFNRRIRLPSLPFSTLRGRNPGVYTGTPRAPFLRLHLPVIESGAPSGPLLSSTPKGKRPIVVAILLSYWGRGSPVECWGVSLFWLCLREDSTGWARSGVVLCNW